MWIGILADDLTGAADSVAPFAQQGYVAGISFWGGDDVAPAWDALSMFTGLRDATGMKPTLMASKVRRVTRRLLKFAPTICFKKIDSTLRGHLRVELDGMLRELPGRIALICPASPANGRTVENGMVRVEGVPLAQTEFVRGVAESQKVATVRTAFEMADDPASAEIGLANLREGIATVEAELERQIAAGIRTFFFDAETLDDLSILAQVVLNRPARYLPVGAAGFTRAIAAALPAAEPCLPPWDTAAFVQGRNLVIVGSMHSMSRRQAQRLMDETGVRQLVLQPQENLEFLMKELTLPERPPEEKLVVMTTPTEIRPEGMRPWLGLAFDWISILEERKSTVTQFDGYVITGGETALEVCHAMKGVNLQIFGESEPGIVRAILNRQAGLAGVPMILKAGGFGDEGTLTRCLGLE